MTFNYKDLKKGNILTHYQKTLKYIKRSIPLVIFHKRNVEVFVFENNILENNSNK